jgi:ribosome maturation factor RimP
MVAGFEKSGRVPAFLFLGSKMARQDLNWRESLEARITSLAEQVAASMGMELVLAEIKGGGNRSIVRTFIDQPGGISLNDCERFSKRFSVVLDVEDCIPFSYVLEVSSPGLDRPLVKEADFRRHIGRTAKVRTRLPLEGQRSFKGTILGVTLGRIDLGVAPGKQVEIALSEIEKANLVAEI